MNPTSKKIWFAAVVAAVSAISFGQVTQQAFKNLPSVKRLMSHEEFTNAGLAKLSDDEIKAIDAWLQKFAVSIVKVNAAPATSEKSSEAIETYISGAFNGWDGETIWKMDNGQIWQQASYAYHYHYTYHPKVVIYAAAGGWKMKVDGDDGEVAVKRIK